MLKYFAILAFCAVCWGNSLADTLVIFEGYYHLGEQTCDPSWAATCFENDCAPRGLTKSWTFKLTPDFVQRLQLARIRVVTQDCYSGSASFNGHSLGVFPVSYDPPCSIAARTATMTSYVTTGTNTVSVAVTEDTLVREIVMEYILLPPPDIQITVTPSSVTNACADPGEPVGVVVNLLSDVDVPDATLDVSYVLPVLRGEVPGTPIADLTVPLVADQVYRGTYWFSLPSCDPAATYATTYDVDVLVTAGSAEFRERCSFSVGGDPAFVDETIATVESCCGACVCRESVVDVVPLLGIPEDMAAYAATQCLAGQYRTYGGATSAGLLEITDGLFAVGSAMHAAGLAACATASGCRDGGALEVSGSVPVVLSSAIDCAVGDFDSLVKERPGSDGAADATKDLAAATTDFGRRLGALLPNSDIGFSNVLLCDSTMVPTVRVGAAWAREDSSSIDRFSWVRLPREGVGIAFLGTTPSPLSAPLTNEADEVTIDLAIVGPADHSLSLVHRDQDDQVRLYEWQFGTTGPSGSGRLQLSRSTGVPILLLDRDGDSVWDESLEPVAETAVGEDAAQAIPIIMHRAFPNPFNPRTTIAFDLSRQEAVTLRVFDVGGRLVTTLIDGEVCDAGRHEAVWRGVDDGGRSCSSGTYFYRLEAGGHTQTKRMVLIR